MRYYTLISLYEVLQYFLIPFLQLCIIAYALNYSKSIKILEKRMYFNLKVNNTDCSLLSSISY